MSDEAETPETPVDEEADTRPQRQRDCDALIEAIGKLGAVASYQRLQMGDLGPTMNTLALIQVLINKGIITEDEIETLKWELMHQVLANFLQHLEVQAAQAKLAQAEAEARRFLGRNGQKLLH